MRSPPTCSDSRARAPRGSRSNTSGRRATAAPSPASQPLLTASAGNSRRETLIDPHSLAGGPRLDANVPYSIRVLPNIQHHLPLLNLLRFNFANEFGLFAPARSRFTGAHFAASPPFASCSGIRWTRCFVPTPVIPDVANGMTDAKTRRESDRVLAPTLSGLWRATVGARGADRPAVRPQVRQAPGPGHTEFDLDQCETPCSALSWFTERESAVSKGERSASNFRSETP